jgi:ankyrin repeat protein
MERKPSLHRSAESGDLLDIEARLLVGARVNQLDEYGCIPLHYAANKGRLEVVEYLISRGSNLQAAGLNGWTPLHYAANKGHIEVAKRLIGAGADPRLCDHEGLRPDQRALARGHHQLSTLLLEFQKQMSGRRAPELPKTEVGARRPAPGGAQFSQRLSSNEGGGGESRLPGIHNLRSLFLWRREKSQPA